MSTMEDTERWRARAQAVDEEFEKLEKFNIDSRRIVLVDEKYERSGGYGIVRQAELYHSAYLPAWLASRRDGPPQLVAVKQIKISAVDIMATVKRAFTKEVLVWSNLGSHPGIAKFLGFHADFKRGEAWLISPWEPNGNISEFTRARNLEVPEKLSLVYDTIDALTFLHGLDPPVCHGDIKSANVLVSSKYKALLCDFGLARLHEDSGFGRLETSTGWKGSIRWCSPEVINGEPRAPTSDVYSWAWLVWEIMTGKLPYEGTSADYAIIRQIFESPRPQVDGESRLSDCLQVWELMMRCWKVDPQHRPTARMCKTTVTYLPRCPPSPENADHQTRSAELLENLGDLESWKGNAEESFAYLDEAMCLYRAAADTRGIASVLRKQAAAAYFHGDYDGALRTASTALEHCRNLNDALGIADASSWLGCSLMMRGENAAALPILHESLEIYRTHGNDVGAAGCLERIGEIQRGQEREQEALSTLGEAVEVASRSGNQLEVGRALATLGITHFDLNDYVKAAEAFSEVHTIARTIGWNLGVIKSLLHLGTIKMRSEAYPEAEELFQESISMARHKRERWGLARALKEFGECLQKQSKLDEAAPVLEESFLLYQALSLRKASLHMAKCLTELRSSQGEWDKVLFWYDHIIAINRSHRDQEKLADSLAKKGRVLVLVKRYDEAALHFEAATVIRMETGYRYCYGWILSPFSAIPKTVMKWERRLPLLCDVRRLQRRLPQLVTPSLKLAISFTHRDA